MGGSRNGLSKINFDLPESIDPIFSNSIKTCLIEQTTASWHFWFGLLEVFVEREHHANVGVEFITEDGFLLGSWVSTQ